MTNDEQDRDVLQMLLTVVRSLVDQPEKVSIVPLGDSTSVTFRVVVDPADVGKLIGMGGRTARALRTILSANSARLKRSFSLNIVELTDSRPQLPFAPSDGSGALPSGSVSLPGSRPR